MGVKNYPLYKITDHARVRIQNRFNITKNDMEAWTSRLLSQAVFVSSQDHFREKYRLNDIVVIIDTRQKMIVTVYSENEHDDNSVHSQTNPEVKAVINDALKTMVKQKKVKTAIKVHDSLAKMIAANRRMVKPYTNYRFTDGAWDEFLAAFDEVKDCIESSLMVISEAEDKIAEG